MYLTRRLFRRKIIALFLFCCIVTYVGYKTGLHLESRQHIKKTKHGILRVLQNSIFGSAMIKDVAVLLTRHETGNYEPPSEPRGKGPGENGEPVTYADWENRTVMRNIRDYSFNQYISDQISLDRSIPDLRPKQCQQWYYPDWLPQASVVITFYNEGWSTLIRTITSVFNRTPPELLKEIILVDDFSYRVHLHKQLDKYIATLPKYKGLVHIIRNDRRLGVMGSRMAGTKLATAPVLVFLDSHCEVGINWLPPLLTVVARNRSTVAVPILDVIDSMTFAVTPQMPKNKIARGAFDWNLDFKLLPGLPEREFKTRQYSSQPYRSPVMPGIFAINKAYFLDMGGYDKGLQMYGGENYELSFKDFVGFSSVRVNICRVPAMNHNPLSHIRASLSRFHSDPFHINPTFNTTDNLTKNPSLRTVCENLLSVLQSSEAFDSRWPAWKDPLVWMCGGSILWVPCSRVAHLYSINGIPSYTFPDGTFGGYRDRNYARVASIWMDGFRDYLYISKPLLQSDQIDIGDIGPQLLFRQERRCQSFNWFMQEVAYDLKNHFPIPPLSVIYGEVRGLNGKVCLDTKGKDPAKHGSSLGLFKCHGLGGNQFFRLTTAGDIRVNGYCLGQQGASEVVLVDCRDNKRVETWVYDEERKNIKRRDTRKCLQRVGLDVELRPCIANMELQLWTFENPWTDSMYPQQKKVGHQGVYGV